MKILVFYWKLAVKIKKWGFPPMLLETLAVPLGANMLHGLTGNGAITAVKETITAGKEDV